MNQRKRSLRFDDFIETLRPDPRSTEEKFLVIKGFLGKSSEEGYVRVYFDDAANFFIEVAESDILHAVPLSAEESSAGGSRLWFSIDTVFLYGDPSKSERRKDTFRSGRLMRDYFKMAQAAALNPFGIGGFFAAEKSGFDPDCEDPPSIWDITPCQACDPSCIISPSLTCAPVDPQLRAALREGGASRTGFERFNPYRR
jgi:hypothetical protein